jgi:hypothetical protein
LHSGPWIWYRFRRWELHCSKSWEVRLVKGGFPVNHHIKVVWRHRQMNTVDGYDLPSLNPQEVMLNKSIARLKSW